MSFDWHAILKIYRKWHPFVSMFPNSLVLEILTFKNRTESTISTIKIDDLIHWCPLYLGSLLLSLLRYATTLHIVSCTFVVSIICSLSFSKKKIHVFSTISCQFYPIPPRKPWSKNHISYLKKTGLLVLNLIKVKVSSFQGLKYNYCYRGVFQWHLKLYLLDFVLCWK